MLVSAALVTRRLYRESTAWAWAMTAAITHPVFTLFVMLSFGLEAAVVVAATVLLQFRWEVATAARFQSPRLNAWFGTALGVVVLARIDLALVWGPFMVAWAVSSIRHSRWAQQKIRTVPDYLGYRGTSGRRVSGDQRRDDGERAPDKCVGQGSICPERPGLEPFDGRYAHRVGDDAGAAGTERLVSACPKRLAAKKRERTSTSEAAERRQRPLVRVSGRRRAVDISMVSCLPDRLPPSQRFRPAV